MTESARLDVTHDPRARSWVDSANQAGCDFPIQNLPFAVFRRGDTLQEGLDKLEALRDPLERVTVDDDSLQWNVALVSALELANLADQAVVIAHSAVNRTESRGAHAREDYQKRDDMNWLKHTCAWKDEDWNVTFAYRPVHLNALSNEVQSFPPAERTH